MIVLYGLAFMSLGSGCRLTVRLVAVSRAVIPNQPADNPHLHTFQLSRGLKQAYERVESAAVLQTAAAHHHG